MTIIDLVNGKIKDIKNVIEQSEMSFSFKVPTDSARFQRWEKNPDWTKVVKDRLIGIKINGDEIVFQRECDKLPTIGRITALGLDGESLYLECIFGECEMKFIYVFNDKDKSVTELFYYSLLCEVHGENLYLDRSFKETEKRLTWLDPQAFGFQNFPDGTKVLFEGKEVFRPTFSFEMGKLSLQSDDTQEYLFLAEELRDARINTLENVLSLFLENGKIVTISFSQSSAAVMNQLLDFLGKEGEDGR